MVIDNFNINGSNIVDVRRVSDFGIAIGGEINVTGKAFRLLEPITCPHTLVGDDFSFKDPSLGLNVLTITADPAIKSTSMIGIQMKDVVIEGGGTNTLFDLTSTGAGNELLSISWSRLGSATAPFASLGTLTNGTLVLHQSTVVGFSTGFTHDGGGFSFISAVSYFAFGNTFLHKISGTFSRATTMQDVDSQFFGGGGFVISIDSGISFQGLRVTDISASGSTSFYDPAGLDQTNPRVLAVGTDDANSYYVGLMSFENNATITTITTQNTFTDIIGTSTAGAINERFTHSTSPNELTYIGIETIKVAVHYTVSATKSGGDIQYGFALFKNSTVVDDSEIQTDITNRTNSVSATISIEISTNDVIKLMVENTESTADLTISNMIVSING